MQISRFFRIFELFNGDLTYCKKCGNVAHLPTLKRLAKEFQSNGGLESMAVSFEEYLIKLKDKAHDSFRENMSPDVKACSAGARDAFDHVFNLMRNLMYDPRDAIDIAKPIRQKVSDRMKQYHGHYPEWINNKSDWERNIDQELYRKFYHESLERLSGFLDACELMQTKTV